MTAGNGGVQFMSMPFRKRALLAPRRRIHTTRDLEEKCLNAGLVAVGRSCLRPHLQGPSSNRYCDWARHALVSSSRISRTSSARPPTRLDRPPTPALQTYANPVCAERAQSAGGIDLLTQRASLHDH